nr:MAG TPA: hypothetical protein [Caudoviricetes sp.]
MKNSSINYCRIFFYENKNSLNHQREFNQT